MKLSRKKLLFLTDWYLPAVNAGGPVRSVSAIVSALKVEFEISVLTSDRDFGSSKKFSEIESDKWISKSGYRLRYLSPEKAKAFILKEVKGDYDKIYLNSLFSFPFTINPLRVLSKKEKQEKVILATRGMLGLGALELKSFKKKFFLKAAIFTRLYYGITWHASTEIEEREIKSVFGRGIQVSVIENLPACQSVQLMKTIKHKGELKMIFVSRISPKKNLIFLLGLMSSLSIRIELDIYGPIEDYEYWNRCEDLISKTKQVIKYKGILAHEELADKISKSHVFVLPTLNENFGHIILETLNSSVPVMISDQTPWRQLKSERAGIDLPLESTEEWLKWINYFIEMDNDEYQKWRKGAWELAQRKLDQKDLVKDYVAMFS